MLNQDKTIRKTHAIDKMMLTLYVLSRSNSSVFFSFRFNFFIFVVYFNLKKYLFAYQKIMNFTVDRVAYFQCSFKRRSVTSVQIIIG